MKAAGDKQSVTAPYSYYIVDGFGNKALDFNQLKQRLTEYKSQHKVFFLHGAYHLYHWPECNLFEKIVTPSNAKLASSSSKKPNLITYVERAFEDYKKTWFACQPEKEPIIVMESKWHHKKAAIAMNDYLNLGFEHFHACEGDIFAYGCSFAKDDHILEALLSNKKLNNLYISVRYKNDKRQAEIEKKIAYFKQRILDADDKHVFPQISWVAIYPEEQHLIWEMEGFSQSDLKAA